MTLNTHIYLTGPVDAKEVFDFCNGLLGAKNPAFTNEESRWDAGIWRYMNQPGQGFNAWLTVAYRPDGPLAVEDVYDEEWLAQKACAVSISFDTGYSYQDEFGNCSALHGRYIRALQLWAEDHGATLAWQNEFTGEVFDGLDGLENFAGEGDEAAAWSRDVVRAIMQGADNGTLKNL